MSLEFRLIEIEKRNPFLIAAMDQAIFEECEAGRSPPTLIYHNWEPAVSIANGQTLSDINFESCKEKKFEVIQMKAGGKAVVHFPDTEFTYSLCIPVESIDIPKMYEKYCGRIGLALKNLGLPSVLVKNNDIFVGRKKIGGNAQHIKQRSLYVMQQGVILYHKPSARDMLSFMNPSLYPKTAEAELDALLTGFSDYSSISQEKLRDTMTKHVLEGYQWKKGFLTEEEQRRVKDLESKYKVLLPSQWNQTRGLCWLPAPVYLKEKAAEAQV